MRFANYKTVGKTLLGVVDAEGQTIAELVNIDGIGMLDNEVVAEHV